MGFPFSRVKNIVGIIIKRACDNKNKVYYSVRVAITIIIVAAIYSRVRVQLGGFGNSFLCAAATILPTTELHVGEMLKKTIISIVGDILGVLLGYGLRMFGEHEIGKVIFTLIVVGILVCFVKVVKDNGPTIFLQSMLMVVLQLLGPDWLTKEFKNAATLGFAYVLIILSSFLPPFWAAVDVHYMLQDYLHTLILIFKGLDEECFRENCSYENLQDQPFLQPLQSLIDSKKKESSLNKFVSWELPWRHLQKQYEKIGDHSRNCARTIYSLSTHLTTNYSTENLHFSTQLRETWRKMCSESVMALTQLSLSMMNKTTPPASINTHLNTALKLASQVENTIEAKDITSRLVESVLDIKKLASSIEELADLVPFKKIDPVSNVPELLIGLESTQRFFPAIQQKVASWTNQSVLSIKKIVSRLLAYYKKFETKCSPDSDGPEPSQPPKMEEHELGHVAINVSHLLAQFESIKYESRKDKDLTEEGA